MTKSASDNPDDHGDLAPFRTLDTSDRRVAGAVYLFAAAVGSMLVLATGIGLMWLTCVLPLIALAAYQFAAGRSMKITDMEAIEAASAAASFDVGHASATLGFSGVLAKPQWQVLAFESGPVPTHQALLTVDALTGAVLGSFEEEVPAV
ncbi:MAG: hypothetical protein ABFR95_04970 [Actinomycetota bacterium]